MYFSASSNENGTYIICATVQQCKMCNYLSGPRHQTCLRGLANNTGADQPGHQRSLISAIVICFLESIIYKLATGEISNFQLYSVSEETGLKFALSETPKTEAHLGLGLHQCFEFASNKGPGSGSSES